MDDGGSGGVTGLGDGHRGLFESGSAILFLSKSMQPLVHVLM